MRQNAQNGGGFDVTGFAFARGFDEDDGFEVEGEVIEFENLLTRVALLRLEKKEASSVALGDKTSEAVAQ